jgi:hypothetical protein
VVPSILNLKREKERQFAQIGLAAEWMPIFKIEFFPAFIIGNSSARIPSLFADK